MKTLTLKVRVTKTLKVQKNENTRLQQSWNSMVISQYSGGSVDNVILLDVIRNFSQSVEVFYRSGNHPHRSSLIELTDSIEQLALESFQSFSTISEDIIGQTILLNNSSALAPSLITHQFAVC